MGLQKEFIDEVNDGEVSLIEVHQKYDPREVERMNFKQSQNCSMYLSK